MSDYRDKARQRVQDKASGDRFKLQEGDNLIRILPNALDKKGKKPKAPYKEYVMHYKVGPNKRSVRCGKDIEGTGNCFICTKLDKLKESGKKAMRKRAAEMDRVPQCGFQIAYMDRRTEKLRGPVWFAVTEGKSNKSLDAKLLGLLGNQRKMIADPKKGYNIHIERTGTTWTDTHYGTPDLDEEPTPVSSKILDKLKPLTEYVRSYDKEFAKKCWYGDDDEEDNMRKRKRDEEEEIEDDELEDDEEESDDEDDEDEKPRRKKKSKKSKKDDDDEGEESDDEDEDDEEESDDEDEDDDDDEDEKPRKKKKSKKSRKDDDEDEDDDEEESDDEDDDVDEDEEDEDEDDEPKKKKGKSSKKKKSKKDDDEEDEDEDSEDEDEEESDDEEEEDEDEEEDEKPKKRGRPKGKKRKK